MDTETLIKTIIDAAYRVRSSFMPGYLESIYENALSSPRYAIGIARRM